MSEDTPDRLDRLLALAWERKLDKACPVDPEAFAQLPPLAAEEKADFAQRNERLIERLRAQPKAQELPEQAHAGVLDWVRQLLAPPVPVTLYRKPEDAKLSGGLDQEIEDQIKRDLEKDPPKP
jgi:hypothetical protein